MAEHTKLYQLSWCSIGGADDGRASVQSNEQSLLHIPVIWPTRREIAETLPFIKNHLEQNDVFARCDVLRIVNVGEADIHRGRQLHVLNIAFEETEDWNNFGEMQQTARMVDYNAVPMRLCLAPPRRAISSYELL